MKVLKIVPMWKDIENSYEKIGKPKNLSRSEFLKKLISYNDKTKTHRINDLLVEVNKGMESVGDSDLQYDCSMLSQLLVSLGNYVDKNGIPNDIDNLSVFLLNTISIHEKYSEDLLNRMYVLNKEDGNIVEGSERLPYSHMVRRFNCLKSACFLEPSLSKRKSIVPKTYIGYDLSSDKFKVLDFNTFQQKALSKEFKDSFDKECVISYSFLNNEFGLTEFCFSDKCNLVDNKIFGQEVLKQENITVNFDKYFRNFIRCTLENFEVFVLC